MKKQRPRQPIESFGPELMTLLKKGSREMVVLTFAGERGKKIAHKFHRRVHALRAAMRAEDHPDYTIAAKVLVSIQWGPIAVAEFGAPQEWQNDHNGNRGAIIIARPRDSEFADVLKEAKVITEASKEPSSLSTEGEPPIEVPKPTRPLSVDVDDEDLDDLMNELRNRPEA